MRQRLALVATVVVVAHSGLASAGPKAVAVAVGDCRDAQLINGMRDFHEALQARWRDELQPPDLVHFSTRRTPSVGLKDAVSQIENARNLYYAGDEQSQKRGVDVVEQAREEIEKMSPLLKPWAPTADALVLEGYILRALGRLPDATDLFRRVLRIDPAFKLDANLFAPSMQDYFEQLRKEHKRARKAALVVQTPGSPGADVYVDGKFFGKTPFKTDLVAGTYRVSVVSGEQVSFTHRQEVPSASPLQIDLPFEGALSTNTPLCFNTPTVPSDQYAVRLGSQLNVERVVVFWKEPKDGPPFFKAMSLKNGVKERDAGVPGGSGASARQHIEQLANFVVTGERAEGVVVEQGAVPFAPLAAAKSPPPAPPGSQLASPRVVEPEPVPVVATSAADHSRISTARIVGFSLVGTGVIAAGAGLAVWATGAADRERYLALAPEGRLPAPSSTTHSEALRLAQSTDSNRIASLAIIGAGAGVAVSGVLTILLFPGRTTSNDDHDQPAGAMFFIAPNAQGAAMSFSGSF